MDIMEEVKFPAKDSEWVSKVAIGGVLGLIPIINFIAFGYYLKVMKGAIEGNSSMPKWEDWGGLFVSGLKVFIIDLIYMIIPTLIIFVSVGGAVVAVFTGGGEEAMGAIAGALGGILIGSLLALIAAFLLPMAIGIYVKADSIGSAFRFGEILSRIKSVFGDYITVFAVLIVLLIVLSVVAGLLNIIPYLGSLIMIFGYFYIAVVGFNMFGKVYAKSGA